MSVTIDLHQTQSDPSRTLHVSVIGGVQLNIAGQDIGLRNRKARAMLAYLALSETGAEPRERLAGLFWSEFGEQNARATLRQAVHEVREAMQAAGCDALVPSRMAVALKSGSFRVDLNELLAAVAAGEAPDVLLRQQRLAEALLAGYEDLDTSFHGWLVARRQTLHDTLVRGLEAGYRDATAPRRRRRRLAEAVLLLDQTHEEACRVVMRCAAEDGEIGAALRAYETLYRILDEDYGQEPSAATQELVAEVKQGKFENAGPEPSEEEAGSSPLLAREMQAAPAPHHLTPMQRPAALPAKPALQINRFGVSGVNRDQAHLVEGFRMELVACLTRFREWYVSGNEGDRTETHSGVPVSARYGLTTTAYQAGSTINVVMVLQEQDSGLAIWGERFELRLDRWFETQQRIVRRIAATLNVQLSTERLMQLSHVPDLSLEAYDIWLRSQAVIRDYTAAEWVRVAQILSQAIERTPNFSPLYSSLAQMNNAVHILQPGIFRDDERAHRTVLLAQRAVALDPRDSRAELCLGWAFAFSRRYSQAELHMDIACELNGNDSWTVMSAAMFQAFNGDLERARQLSALSMELTLSPAPSQWVYLASIRYLLGDYEGSIVAADRAEDALLTVAAWRTAALSALGRTADARNELARFYASIRSVWTGDIPPSSEAITRWFLEAYPISSGEIWRQLREGVARAGAPVAGLVHQG